MENQLEANMENEMRTSIYIGVYRHHIQCAALLRRGVLFWQVFPRLNFETS